MPVPFLNSVNLNKNEVQNFKVFNIGNDPTPTLTANDGGYFWFDSTTTPTPVLRLKYWTGTEARTLLDSASTTIVAADLSGGAAGSLPYQVGAGDTDFLGIGTAGQVLSVSSGVPAWVNQSSLSVGSATTAATADKVANALTAGTYLTAGGTFDGSTARTFAVDATSANTASKVVARDGSGNFSAGTITASLTGTASNATNVNGGDAGSLLYQTATNFTGALSLGSAGYILRVNTGATAPEWSATIPSSSVSGLAASATTDTTNAANISSGLLPLARLALATGQFYLGDASNNPVATAKTSIPLSGFGAAGADVAMGGFKITGLADPVDATDAANRKYVDEVAQGLDVKASCLTATTTNINLSAPTASIGGVTISTVGSRVLVKDQTDKTQNGIYLWQGASSAMTRSLDADTVAKLVGAFTFVEQGTNADSGWVCQVDSGTIGSVDIEWTKFSQAGSYTAGNGMVLSGGVFHFAQSSAYTAGQIPFCSNSPTANSIGFSSNLFWDNGNNRLGIGTTPSESLDVNGAIYVRGANALKLDNASNNYVAQIKNTGASGQSSLEFLLGSPYGTKMTLDNSGNLGLGVTPSFRLDVKTATDGNHIRVSGAGQNAITFGNNTSTAGQGFLLGRSVSSDNANNFFLYDLTSGNTRMLIDSSGNVGIGTATPGLRLDVVGFGRFQSTTGSSQVVLSNDGGLLNFAIDSSTGGNFGEAYSKNIYCTGAQPLRFWTNGVDRMRIDSTGNVGIGTATPAYPLDISASKAVSRLTSSTGTNGAFSFFSNTGGAFYIGLDNSAGTEFSAAYSGAIWHSGAYPIVFATSNAEKMRLDSSGNLGLGVTPSAWSLGRAFENSAGAFFGYSTSELHVTQNAYYNAGWKYTNSSVGAGRYFINSGAHSWYTAPSGTAGTAISFTQAMTLDASGNLGLGATTTVGGRLVITQDNSVQPAIYLPVDESTILGPNANTFLKFGGNLSAKGAGTLSMQCGTGVIQFVTGSSPSEKMRLDGSGNLGLGVTPKVWNGNYRAIQIGLAGAIFNDNFNEDLNVSSNAYYDSTDNRYEFIRTGYAQRYTQTNGGQHRWYTSTSAGNADTAITFTQAMTLDASGNLLVGSTGIISGTAGIQIGTGKQLIFDNGTGQNSSPISNVDSALIYTSGAGGTFGFNGHLVLQPRGSAAGAIIMATGSGAGAMAERLRLNDAGTLLFKTNGTASAPTIANADNPDTGLYWPTDNDTLALAVGGSDAVYIDSSRNVGIGTNPGYKLDIRDNSTGLLARLSSTSTGGCSMQFVSTSTNGRTYRIGSNYVSGAGEFSIYDDTAGLERLRIKSTGQVNFVGLASDPAGAAGDVVYNSTSNRLKYHNGTAWVDSGTRKVSVVGGAGTGTYIDATHNFNTKTVSVTVLRTTDNVVVYTDVAMTNDNTVRVTFASSVTLADYTVTVIG